MNRGRYCPVYNPMGTYKDTGSKNWYETTFPITSVYSAFQNIGTVIGRPDSKSNKYIYTDQFIDLRTNAEKANIPQLLNEVHNGAVNGSFGGYSDTVGTEQVTQTTIGTVETLEVGTKLKYSVGDVLQIWNGTTPYRRFVLSVSGTIVTLDSTIVKTAVAFIISGGKLPIISYKTSLSTDIIGSPVNYPSIMTGRLASGKQLIGLNLLLVGQDGSDYNVDGIFRAILSNKVVVDLVVQESYDGTSYVANSYTLSQAGGSTIGNDIDTEVTSYVMRLVHYTSSNPVANIATPKAVQQVGNYAVATNSHSLYKGNNLTQLIGKVAVGNGVKGLVSKVVEDYVPYAASGGKVTLVGAGFFRIFDLDLRTQLDVPNLSVVNNSIGTVYNKTKDTYFQIVTIYVKDEYGYNVYYYENGVPSVGTTAFSVGDEITLVYGYAPTHSTIALDNSNSPAIKMLSTIAQADDGELLYQVFGEEGKLNTTWGFDTDFSQLTNGTLVDLNGATVRTIVASVALGQYK